MELQLSRAKVHSPEHREGAGLDQLKWSASLRGEGLLGTRPVYGLFEWAHTDEASGAFQFESWLGEGAITLGRVRPYMRLELTERPEEERISAFRSRRPHFENSILGASRWTTFTGGVEVQLLPASSRFSRRTSRSRARWGTSRSPARDCSRWPTGIRGRISGP